MDKQVNPAPDQAVSLYDRQNRKGWFQVNRYYALNYDFFDMDPHTHSEFEMMYVASGDCRIYHWGTPSLQEELHLKEGEYVVIDCNVRHQLEVARGTRCRMLNLEISVLPGEDGSTAGMNLHSLCQKSQSLQDFMLQQLPVWKGSDDDAGSLHKIITELHRQLQSPEDENEHQIQQNLILAQLLIELGRQRKKKQHPQGGGCYIRKALFYLSEHFEQDITVSQIADETGLSSAYLQRLFKEQTGSTLVEHLNKLRIEKARILLETSRLPVVDVAISVGFHNRQHFTHTFMQLVGTSPARYRKHKGNYVISHGYE